MVEDGEMDRRQERSPAGRFDRKRPERYVGSDVRTKVQTLLFELGDSPEEVAGSLQHAGVHGVRRDVWACPVASYLHAVVSGEQHVRAVSVDTDFAVVSRDGWWRRSRKVALPLAVRAFVLGFDAGQFETLAIRRDPGDATPTRGPGDPGAG